MGECAKRIWSEEEVNRWRWRSDASEGREVSEAAPEDVSEEPVDVPALHEHPGEGGEEEVMQAHSHTRAQQGGLQGQQ